MEESTFARIKVGMLIKFHELESMEDVISGRADELTMTSIFIRTDEVKKPGSRIHIELPIPNSDPVRVYGTVSSIRYEKGEPVGMGIEFDLLEDPALGVIRYLVEKGSGKGK